jgi:hypothetical protein
MIGDAGQHIGEPGREIDVVELGGDDQAVEQHGALTTTMGAGEQPGLRPSAKPRNALSAALLVKQMRPSSKKQVKDVQRLSM